MDSEKYAKYMWYNCKNNREFSTLRGLVNSRVSNNRIGWKYEDVLAALYINDSGALCQKAVQVAGSNRDSTIQYNNLRKLLLDQGIIKFEDTYKLGRKALDEYGAELTKLLGLRFNFIFIDEYQDCDSLQCSIINNLFNTENTVVQKIGDVDQAIYSGGYTDEENPWDISRDALLLSGSNRYHKLIADVLTCLKTNQEEVISLCKNIAIKPVLIVYKPEKISSVLEIFASEIEKNHLSDCFPDGKYKAVGMIKNGRGITIGDYWSGYQKEDNLSNSLVLDDYVLQIQQCLREGNLGLIENCIRKMLSKVLFTVHHKNKAGNNYYTFNYIKKHLFELEGLSYREKILEITKIKNCNLEKIREFLKAIIYKIIVDESERSVLNEFFSLENTGEKNEHQKKNIWISDATDIQVEFATVYKVKGETHLATLYLETETKSASDLKRIMPLFKGDKINQNSAIYEKSRKVVYVGLSRPTHLLCMAMQQKTYLGNENAFENWEVIELYE